MRRKKEEIEEGNDEGQTQRSKEGLRLAIYFPSCCVLVKIGAEKEHQTIMTSSPNATAVLLKIMPQQPNMVQGEREM